jgi:hypothetical protein
MLTALAACNAAAGATTHPAAAVVVDVVATVGSITTGGTTVMIVTAGGSGFGVKVPGAAGMVVGDSDSDRDIVAIPGDGVAENDVERLLTKLRDRCDEVRPRETVVLSDPVMNDTVVEAEGEDDFDSEVSLMVADMVSDADNDTVTEDNTVAAEVVKVDDGDVVLLLSTVGEGADEVGLGVGGFGDRFANDTVVVAEGENEADREVSLTVGDTVIELVGDADHDAVAEDDTVAAGAVGDKVLLRAAVGDPCDLLGLAVGGVGDSFKNDPVVVAEGENDVDGEVSLMVGVTVTETVGDDDKDTVANDDSVAAGAEAEGVTEDEKVLLLSAVGLSVGGDGERVAKDTVMEIDDADDDSVAR